MSIMERNFSPLFALHALMGFDDILDVLVVFTKEKTFKIIFYVEAMRMNDAFVHNN